MGLVFNLILVFENLNPNIFADGKFFIENSHKLILTKIYLKFYLICFRTCFNKSEVRLLQCHIVASGTQDLHKISSPITIFCNYFQFLSSQSGVFYLNIMRFLPRPFWSPTLSATLSVAFQCLSIFFGGRFSQRMTNSTSFTPSNFICNWELTAFRDKFFI